MSQSFALVFPDSQLVLVWFLYSDRGLMVKIWIKTRPLKQFDVAREYRLRLKLAFDKAGITIPVPQQNISVHFNLISNNGASNIDLA